MLKKFAVCAAVMASLYTASALAAPTLRVGSETTFPPFEFVDVKTKQFVGYEIDLINAVGKKAGYNISVQSMGFDAIIPALMTGTVDVGVSGMTITAERKKKVDFTVPVFKGGLVAVVRQKDAAAYKTPAAIKGKQVCAQLGTTGQLKAEEISGKKARTFNNAAEAMMELRNGGCDAVVADKPVIEYFLKESRQSRYFHELPTQLTTEDWGFAVKKGNKKVLNALNSALVSLQKDGTVAKIHKKWFNN